MEWEWHGNGMGMAHKSGLLTQRLLRISGLFGTWWRQLHESMIQVFACEILSRKLPEVPLLQRPASDSI